VAEQRFQDKVVVITGAASGIGRALVTAFVRQGAKGVIADRDREWADEVANALRQEGGEVTVFTTDVTKSEQVNALLRGTLDAYGQLDVFVNNAGVGIHRRVVDLTEEEWDYQVDVQLKGTFLCAQAAARQFIAQGRGGRIINIGSGAAVNARVDAAPHCASKAGIVMLTKVMALELGEHNITVNCVSPGLIDVSQVSRHGGASEGYIEAFLQMVPLNRLGKPDEIANMVLFLASDQANFVTGAHILVDGGYSAGKLSVHGPHRVTRY
jgi:NAD(P)-dependent dehydrogenase (short-subunit alcohol dehydrogenase family)